MLSPNRDTAERIFPTVQKRLHKDNALRTIYEKQMLGYIVKQEVELEPTTEELTVVIYVTHHGVKYNAVENQVENCL